MKKNEKKRKKGFTLVELIVVIAILGILAAVVVPRFTGFKDKASSTQTLVNAKQIATAIDSLIAEGTTLQNNDTTKQKILNLAGVTGGTLTLDDSVNTNGFFTYNDGTYTAVRSSTGITVNKNAGTGSGSGSGSGSGTGSGS